MNMIVLDYKSENSIPTSAVALGKFEGLHLGHALLIRGAVDYAKEKNAQSVVFTIRQPGTPRIYTSEERARILTVCGVDVDMECAFTPEFMAMTPEAFAKDVLADRLHAGCVFVGEDFRFGKNRAGDAALLKELGKTYGFDVRVFEKLCVDGAEVSSSRIRGLMEAGHMDAVNNLLGRDYSITGLVREGKKLGRTIGFPTLNLIPDENKLLPKSGVYATEAEIDGRIWRAITNVGSNPTVESGNRIKVETHLLDFSEDAYGKEITVRFLRFIRDEKRFSSIDELKEQIKSDLDLRDAVLEK